MFTYLDVLAIFIGITICLLLVAGIRSYINLADIYNHKIAIGFFSLLALSGYLGYLFLQS